MRVDGEGPGGTGGREVAVPEEAAASAEAIGAEVREVAASLPFGADPGAFAAALERLAVDDEAGEEVLP